MAIAQGVFKQTRFKRQTAKGTIATNTAGQVLRRKSSTFELQRDKYDTSDEITQTQQLTSVRLGAKLVNGQIDGLLSPGTWADIFSAVLRRDYTAVTAITGASITIAASGGGYTLTDAANTFLTKGLKIGMVIRLTAGSFNAANLNKNLLITSVTQTVITVMVVNASTMIAEGPIAAATVTVPGKVTYPPATGQTQIYYTVEEWMPDVPYSEVFQDVRFSQLQFALPGQGNATVQAQGQGLDRPIGVATVYFASPTAETTSEICCASSGVLQVQGVTQASITDISFTVATGQNPADPVVGSNLRPDIFIGVIMVTGQFTAYFDTAAAAINDLFVNETDVNIVGVLANGSTAAADFISYALGKLNVTAAGPADGQTGLKRTFQFTAEYNAAGGAALANQQTIIQFQDSLAP